MDALVNDNFKKLLTLYLLLTFTSTFNTTENTTI